MALRFITIRKFGDETGYTEKAVRNKIDRGEWLEGEVWARAPDGRILIDCTGFERWVERGVGASGRRQRAV